MVMVMKAAVAVAAVPVLDALSGGQEGDRGEIVRGPFHQIVLSGGKHHPTPHHNKNEEKSEGDEMSSGERSSEQRVVR
jgi:hypothetical protein